MVSSQQSTADNIPGLGWYGALGAVWRSDDIAKDQASNDCSCRHVTDSSTRTLLVAQYPLMSYSLRTTMTCSSARRARRCAANRSIHGPRNIAAPYNQSINNMTKCRPTTWNKRAIRLVRETGSSRKVLGNLRWRQNRISHSRLAWCSLASPSHGRRTQIWRRRGNCNWSWYRSEYSKTSTKVQHCSLMF